MTPWIYHPQTQVMSKFKRLNWWIFPTQKGVSCHPWCCFAPTSPRFSNPHCQQTKWKEKHISFSMVWSPFLYKRAPHFGRLLHQLVLSLAHIFVAKLRCLTHCSWAYPWLLTSSSLKVSLAGAEVEVVQHILPSGGFKLVDNVVKLDSHHLPKKGWQWTRTMP